MSEQSNNAVATAGKQRGIDVLKNILAAPSIQEQFKNALAENSGAFTASIIDLYNSDNTLQTCEPKTVVMEALKAATLKLPINKALGFSYLVPYYNSQKQADGSWLKVMVPTFQLGYKGYIQLAMRTGQYKTINADLAYDGEVRTVNKLTGEIAFDGERKSDKVSGYFCYFELLNGFSKTLYMTAEQVKAHAQKYSKSYSGKSSPWQTEFDSMAMKTVIRLLLSKYGYLSIEMQGALNADVEPDGDRDEKVQAFGNAKEFPAQEVAYEEVGTGAKSPSAEQVKEEPKQTDKAPF